MTTTVFQGGRPSLCCATIRNQHHSALEQKGVRMWVRSSLLWFLLVSTSVVAQTFRGAILGTVTDPGGAVVAGATVTAHNINTGLDRATTTSGDGSYSIPELPI